MLVPKIEARFSCDFLRAAIKPLRDRRLEERRSNQAFIHSSLIARKSVLAIFQSQQPYGKRKSQEQVQNPAEHEHTGFDSAERVFSSPPTSIGGMVDSVDRFLHEVDRDSQPATMVRAREDDHLQGISRSSHNEVLVSFSPPLLCESLIVFNALVFESITTAISTGRPEHNNAFPCHRHHKMFPLCHSRVMTKTSKI